MEENPPRHSIPGRGQNIYLNLAEETVCSIPCNIMVVQLLDVPSSSSKLIMQKTQQLL
ncbi:hypothetical protein K439DRAFT_1629852 [Ramaria rubella]|nr:hypothetical protein K439DRAFT_1629852 [Ramaria rubella]